MCKEFNVIKEPCIPVRMITGEFTTLSIRDVFDKAVDIKGVYCQSPFEEYGLKRMLAVFVMDFNYFETEEDIFNLYLSGKFDMGKFDSYISMCEEKGDVFNLFSSEYPFYQTKYNEEIDKNIYNIDELFYELPSGTKHTFFQRKYDGFSPTSCLAGLTALSVFLPGQGGEGYCFGVNGDSPTYYWKSGNNLFHELCLNSISKEIWEVDTGIGTEDRHFVKYGGEPIWRRTKPIESKVPFYDISLFEALTFMGRRVTLMDFRDNGNVYKISKSPASKYMLYERDKNNKIIYCSAWRDPYCAYNELNKDYDIIRPMENEVHWLNNAVFYDNSANKAPLILNKLGVNNMGGSYSVRKLKKWDLDSLNLVKYGGYNKKQQGLYQWWYKQDISIEVEITDDKEKSQYFYKSLIYVQEVAKRIKSRLINKIDLSDFYVNSYNYVHGEFKDNLLSSTEDNIENVVNNLKRELLEYAVLCYEKNIAFKKIIRYISNGKISDSDNNPISIYYLDLKILRQSICKFLDITKEEKGDSV